MFDWVLNTSLGVNETEKVFKKRRDEYFVITSLKMKNDNNKD